jgi:hypothetical protein
MVTGQSAATAACLAIDAASTVQQVNYSKLSQCLLADGQILTPPARASWQGVDASLEPRHNDNSSHSF